MLLVSGANTAAEDGEGRKLGKVALRRSSWKGCCSGDLQDVNGHTPIMHAGARAGAVSGTLKPRQVHKSCQPRRL